MSVRQGNHVPEMSALNTQSNTQSNAESDADSDTELDRPESSAEESGNENFRPVLDAINLGALAAVAMNARKKHDGHAASKDLTCDIQTPALFGSFNLTFVISFSDKVRWIARIPGSGVSSFGKLEARMHLSDIRTISFIRSHTSIPIPEVFALELTSDNPVRVPYHLESFIEGRPLLERWMDQLLGNESARMKVLEDLAGLMSQLHTLHFDSIGSLAFGSDGVFPHVEAMVKMKSSYENLLNGDDVWGTASLCGPFKSTRDYLLAILQVQNEATFTDAELCLLRQAIDSIPPFLDTAPTFSLGHPDFNYQNIFISDEGEITGIIDWDGIHTLPRALGLARYPSWITRDWDPAKYGYDKPDCPVEDSPAQLLSYRRKYAASMASFHLPEENYSAHDTTLSQILEAVEIAVEDTVCRPWILNRLLEFAFDGKAPFTIGEFYNTWLEGKPEVEAWSEEARRAFGQMWHEE